MSIPESPKNDYIKELTEEEVFGLIFPQNVEQMNELFEQNLDYLYNISIQKSEIISSNNINKDKSSQIKKDTKDINLILDDYEMYYNQFADLDENEIKESEKDDNSPFFLSNIYYDKEILFSPIEDEKILKIEKSIEKQKNKDIEMKVKQKIFQIEKNLKKNEKSILKKKNTSRASQKLYKKFKKKSFNEFDKYFPFNIGRGIIYNLNPNFESSSKTTEISTSPQEVSGESLDFNHSDCSEPDENIGLKNKKEKEKEKERKRKYKKKEKQSEDKKFTDEINYDSEKNNYFSNMNLIKFKIKRYFVDENGKKKKIKKRRKFKPDDIRKKIKSRFHKTFKNIINENLKKVGSNELFDYLPQCFIGNISKDLNSKCLELTFKQLLSINFVKELNKKVYPNSKIDINKYKKNISTLNYLEINPKISKKSGFDIIKDKKYKDILSIYFTSLEFENSLIQLKKENESDEYILEYINYARNYISFYANKEIGTNNVNIEENNEREKADEIE